MISNEILISIIIPYYNDKNNLLIKYATKLDKILNNLPVEIIYIDDGSTDKSYENLSNINLKSNLFRFIRLKKNNGPGIARNLGIKKSKGQYLIFLDSDDMLIKKGIQKLLEKVRYKKNFDLIFLNYIKKEIKQINLSKSNFTKKDLLKKYLRTELDMGPNFYLFRKKFIQSNKFYFKKGYYEDILFMLKVFTKMKRYSHFLFKVYIKNNNKNSITNNFSFKHLKDFNNACVSKKNYFLSNIDGNFEGINYNDLQFGLRGDYVFSQKILKKCRANYKKIELNKLFYKKIISDKFIPLTTYDKIVMKDLFN
jgi:glycosyltransferase involved in cell wall biosynthesis